VNTEEYRRAPIGRPAVARIAIKYGVNAWMALLLADEVVDLIQAQPMAKRPLVDDDDDDEPVCANGCPYGAHGRHKFSCPQSRYIYPPDGGAV
jgi:hypothetical protein